MGMVHGTFIQLTVTVSQNARVPVTSSDDVVLPPEPLYTLYMQATTVCEEDVGQ